MPCDIKLVIFSYEHFVKPVVSKENPTRLDDMKNLQCVFATLKALHIKFIFVPETFENAGKSRISSSQLFLLSGIHSTAETMPWYNSFEQQQSLIRASAHKAKSLDIAVCEYYGKKSLTHKNEVLLASREAIQLAILKDFNTISLNKPTLCENLFEILLRVRGHDIALALTIDHNFKLGLTKYIAGKDEERAKKFIGLLEILVLQTKPRSHWFSSKASLKDTLLAGLLKQSQNSASPDPESLLQEAAYICSIEDIRGAKKNIHLQALTEQLNSQIRFHEFRDFIKKGAVNQEDVRTFGKETLAAQLDAETQFQLTEPESAQDYVNITLPE